MKSITELLAKYRVVVLCLLVFAWTAALVITHTPAEELPRFPTNDTNLHVTGFFGLATLLFWTLSAYGVSGVRRAIICLVALALYAALDEKTQPWFNRDCDLRDWEADIAGTVVAIAFWQVSFFLMGEKIRKRKSAGKKK
jgi:VanZ family protein